jgi:hypothetical protein
MTAPDQWVVSIRCKDDYHDLTEKTLPVWTSTDKDNCNAALIGSTVINYVIPSVDINDTSDNAEFLRNLNAGYAASGWGSSIARNIMGLFIIVFVMIFAYVQTKSEIISMIAGMAGLLICFFLNLISIFPIIVLMIVSILGLLWQLKDKFSSGG